MYTHDVQFSIYCPLFVSKRKYFLPNVSKLQEGKIGLNIWSNKIAVNQRRAKKKNFGKEEREKIHFPRSKVKLFFAFAAGFLVL